MRRAGRILFSGVTLFSLLLALAEAAAWGPSYLRYDSFGYFFAKAGTCAFVDTSRGRALFGVQRWIDDVSTAVPFCNERLCVTAFSFPC